MAANAEPPVAAAAGAAACTARYGKGPKESLLPGVLWLAPEAAASLDACLSRLSSLARAELLLCPHELLLQAVERALLFMLLQAWPELLLLVCFAAWMLESRASSVLGWVGQLVGVVGTVVAAEAGYDPLAKSKALPGTCPGLEGPRNWLAPLAGIDTGVSPRLSIEAGAVPYSRGAEDPAGAAAVLKCCWEPVVVVCRLG